MTDEFKNALQEIHDKLKNHIARLPKHSEEDEKQYAELGIDARRLLINLFYGYDHPGLREGEFSKIHLPRDEQSIMRFRNTAGASYFHDVAHMLLAKARHFGHFSFGVFDIVMDGIVSAVHEYLEHEQISMIVLPHRDIETCIYDGWKTYRWNEEAKRWDSL